MQIFLSRINRKCNSNLLLITGFDSSIAVSEHYCTSICMAFVQSDIACLQSYISKIDDTDSNRRIFKNHQHKLLLQVNFPLKNVHGDTNKVTYIGETITDDNDVIEVESNDGSPIEHEQWKTHHSHCAQKRAILCRILEQYIRCLAAGIVLADQWMNL